MINSLGIITLDPLYFLLVGPAMLLALWAQFRVKSTYHQTARVPARSGLTGAEARPNNARRGALTPSEAPTLKACGPLSATNQSHCPSRSTERDSEKRAVSSPAMTPGPARNDGARDRT